MVDDIVDASAPRGRVDIRVGVGGRRRWSGEAKGRIVAEIVCAGGGRVGGGAPARHVAAASVCLAQGGAAGLVTLPADAAPMFVPVVREIVGDDGAGGAAANGSGAITIEIAGAVVHAEPGVDPGWLRDVLWAVKAAT